LSAHRALASVILLATASIKAVGLVSGPKWIHQPDTLLGAPNWIVILAAITAEVTIGLALFRPGRTPILGLRGLTAVFAGYHTLRLLTGAKEPCACLGRLSDWSPFFRDHGEGITLLILLCLAWLSSFEESADEPKPVERGAIAPVVVSCLLWAVLGSVAIAVGSGRGLGGDEGMELSKLALVQSLGGIPSAWNDQNWLFTLFLRGVASLHPGIDFLRAFCFSLTFSVPIVATLLCIRKGMPWAGLLFPLLVFSQAGAAVLMSSVMMEAPAVGVGTAAAIPLLMAGPATPLRCWISGLIAALAVTLKPTAAFALVPAVVLAFQGGVLSRFLVASTACGAISLAGSIFCGLVQPSIFAQSHSAKPPHPIAWEAWGASGSGLLLLCAVVGLWFRGVAVWALGLAFAVLVLALHQPAWSYYHIHFWIPAAGLFVLAVRSRVAVLVIGLVCIGLTAHQLRLIRTVSTVIGGVESAWVPAIRAARPTSMFSGEPLLHYLTGVAPHPEFAVLPLKRTWAGYSASHLSNDIVRIRPQVLVLSRDHVGQIGTNGYALIGKRGTSLLLALPELGMVPEPPQPSILKLMGL
jgi:hypothetical protein